MRCEKNQVMIVVSKCQSNLSVQVEFFLCTSGSFGPMVQAVQEATEIIRTHSLETV